ncbi:MAG: hypothetical protein M3Y59_04200 [Myxococcota bacterium]|nr:hypothetical protein [Myxococcota bacterium]
MSELPSQARFQGALNQPFEVGPFTAPDGTPLPFQVQLVEVRQLVPGGPESFALRFRGPATPMLQQGTYPFTHAELGTLALFVVPVAKDATGADYEAVFNRG